MDGVQFSAAPTDVRLHTAEDRPSAPMGKESAEKHSERITEYGNKGIRVFPYSRIPVLEESKI